LVTLLNQSLNKRLGFFNPLLYRTLAATRAFRSIVQGNNGDYGASAGWNACTGWGSPIGTRLLRALQP